MQQNPMHCIVFAISKMNDKNTFEEKLYEQCQMTTKYKRLPFEYGEILVYERVELFDMNIFVVFLFGLWNKM